MQPAGNRQQKSTLQKGEKLQGCLSSFNEPFSPSELVHRLVERTVSATGDRHGDNNDDSRATVISAVHSAIESRELFQTNGWWFTRKASRRQSFSFRRLLTPLNYVDSVVEDGLMELLFQDHRPQMITGMMIGYGLLFWGGLMFPELLFKNEAWSWSFWIAMVFALGTCPWLYMVMMGDVAPKWRLSKANRSKLQEALFVVELVALLIATSTLGGVLIEACQDRQRKSNGSSSLEKQEGLQALAVKVCGSIVPFHPGTQILVSTVAFSPRLHWFILTLVPMFILAPVNSETTIIKDLLTTSARTLTYVELLVMGAFALISGYLKEKMVRRLYESLVALQVKQESVRQNVADVNAVMKWLLPPTVLERKLTGSEIVDTQVASVLQSDICMFTKWCSTRSASQVVDMLSSVIAEFDSYASQKGITRVKTVGDGYIAACGIPVRNDQHAEVMLIFGLSLTRILNKLCDDVRHHSAWGALEVRVGVHCGVVHGAMLSSQRWAYDLYGEVPKIASLLEQGGAPDTVTFSQAIKDKIGEEVKFSDHLYSIGKELPGLEGEEVFQLDANSPLVVATIATDSSPSSSSKGKYGREDHDVDEEVDSYYSTILLDDVRDTALKTIASAWEHQPDVATAPRGARRISLLNSIGGDISSSSGSFAQQETPLGSTRSRGVTLTLGSGVNNNTGSSKSTSMSPVDSGPLGILTSVNSRSLLSRGGGGSSGIGGASGSQGGDDCPPLASNTPRHHQQQHHHYYQQHGLGRVSSLHSVVSLRRQDYQREHLVGSQLDIRSATSFESGGRPGGHHQQQQTAVLMIPHAAPSTTTNFGGANEGDWDQNSTFFSPALEQSTSPPSGMINYSSSSQQQQHLSPQTPPPFVADASSGVQVVPPALVLEEATPQTKGYLVSSNEKHEAASGKGDSTHAARSSPDQKARTAPVEGASKDSSDSKKSAEQEDDMIEKALLIEEAPVLTACISGGFAFSNFTLVAYVSLNPHFESSPTREVLVLLFVCFTLLLVLWSSFAGRRPSSQALGVDVGGRSCLDRFVATLQSCIPQLIAIIVAVPGSAYIILEGFEQRSFSGATGDWKSMHALLMALVAQIPIKPWQFKVSFGLMALGVLIATANELLLKGYPINIFPIGNWIAMVAVLLQRSNYETWRGRVAESRKSFSETVTVLEDEMRSLQQLLDLKLPDHVVTPLMNAYKSVGSLPKDLIWELPDTTAVAFVRIGVGVPAGSNSCGVGREAAPVSSSTTVAEVVSDFYSAIGTYQAITDFIDSLLPAATPLRRRRNLPLRREAEAKNEDEDGSGGGTTHSPPLQEARHSLFPHLEKVKTLGDLVIVAGSLDPTVATNLPSPGVLAYEMLVFLKSLCQGVISCSYDVGGHSQDEHADDDDHETPLEKEQYSRQQPMMSLMCGVTLGPVTTAVIGNQQLEYDLFGTTVNTASRILSSIPPSPPPGVVAASDDNDERDVPPLVLSHLCRIRCSSLFKTAVECEELQEESTTPPSHATTTNFSTGEEFDAKGLGKIVVHELML